LTYLLDTNAVVAMLRNRPARVRERLRRAVSENTTIVVSSVVLFELWYGVARSGRREENTERLRVFLSGNVGIVPFEDRDAAIAGDLRASLEASGMVIGPYDLLIAAQALRTDATLATANVSEFARVPGLVWEDWTVEP
jgi:tRNA(fMet)-specific endonuclease VapC